MYKALLAGLLAGTLGGASAAVVVVRLTRVPSVTMRAPELGRTLSAERVQLVDARGRVRAELALSGDGGPGLFFYDSRGKNRMVVGLYGEAEREAPTVVLNDPSQRAAGIFRLHGSTDAPVVVLKSDGSDRSIYGLSPASREPYLVNVGTNGQRVAVFGAP